VQEISPSLNKQMPLQVARADDGDIVVKGASGRYVEVSGSRPWVCGFLTGSHRERASWFAGRFALSALSHGDEPPLPSWMLLKQPAHFVSEQIWCDVAEPTRWLEGIAGLYF
jgi:hypothetical protein